MPYTIGLLKSIPRLDEQRKATLDPIRGTAAGPDQPAGRLPVRAALRLSCRRRVCRCGRRCGRWASATARPACSTCTRRELVRGRGRRPAATEPPAQQPITGAALREVQHDGDDVTATDASHGAARRGTAAGGAGPEDALPADARASSSSARSARCKAVDGISLRASGGARRSGWWARAAAANRRPAARSCSCTSRPRARCSSKGRT